MIDHDDDYLWNPRAAAPDQEIVMLETALQPFRHQLPPFVARRSTLDARRSTLAYSIAAGILVAVIGGTAWWTTRAQPWEVELTSGTATLGSVPMSAGGQLDQARVLETGAGSGARVRVADIGTADLSANSRVRFVGERDGAQRIALEAGEMYVRIWAPPRTFVVETPAGVATDLGCVYRLRVDSGGVGLLGVEEGEVEVEAAGIRVLVSAGALVSLDSAHGPSVPVSNESSPQFRRAVNRLAAGALDSAALDTVLRASTPQATTSLFHLIPRVHPTLRQALVDSLAERAPLPAGVDRNALVRLDTNALGAWRESMRDSWQREDSRLWARALVRLGVVKPRARISFDGLMARPVQPVPTLPLQPPPAQRRDTVVRTVGAPRYPGVATLIEELTIGTVSGADQYMLSKVGEIAVGKDGTIYVLDRSRFTIRVYDAAGKWQRDIGRRGDGPGEMQSPVGIAIHPDGRLLLWDNRHWRLSAFSPAGANLAQWTIRATGAVGGERSLIIDSAGFAWARQASLVRPSTPPAGRAGGMTISSSLNIRGAWLKFNTTTGAVIDSIVEPTLPPFAEPFRARGGGGMLQMAMPYAPRRVATLSPSGYAITGIGERYAFELHQPGRPIVSVRRNLPPVPITARDRDAASTNIETKMKEVDPLWTWAGRDLPRVHPYFVDILTGVDGRIWLQRDKPNPPLVRAAPPPPGRSSAGAATTVDPNSDYVFPPINFDVFEPSGVLIGQVRFPPRVTPKVMRGDYVWAVALDADDVEYVKRYRIAWR